ncbi:MAG TPA: hypothetical protein VK590_05500 [Saprospiraceae bacterium]|nr:hypothetical protein [Saprospiraceae bacterium]
MEYKEVPCKCGFTYEENKKEFEIYHMRMGTFMGQELTKKPVPRCKTCKTISILERAEDGMETSKRDRKNNKI